MIRKAFGIAVILLCASALGGGPVEKLTPEKADGGRVFRLATTNGTVLVSEGGGEAASMGSYSIRVMDDDRFKAGVVLPRDGSILELIMVANVGGLPIKYPKVEIARDRNAEPRGGKARAHYDAKANTWIRE
jgi:hypothetical protein